MKYLRQFTPSSEPHARQHSWHRAGVSVWFRFGILFLAAGLGVARGETLPLPIGLIALDSEQRERVLWAAEATNPYFPPALHFVTRAPPVFCGPASIAMVLNALHVPRPPSKLTLGLGLYDQENIFDARTEAIKARSAVLQAGMTL